ncbi:cleavage polyadenylation factor subunit CFT2 NDAI_0G02680 [Naumovozyma dairenensis CBS 421]|uniref:Cleavage and polyadenylation specificity factor subunit 2 n=1 Tax=Naumovozyma dairenensis (strain ATCC 10597 / BCRC 20456 / CBS 421 / NBRC 0211 / NRRL Y-12639) TaxID=1071378 RepID=G0WE34_NAUDC|nr:hypothetical protein NDAI_0G02680 [Naumovozyma dairenensis CBS 421]CCD26045.2 hypothetical protein NDAI_0G02680 [Naumovozyma dairenensis CBS 421]
MTYKVSCCDDGSGQTVGTLLKFDNVVTILIDPGWASSAVSYEDSVRYWTNVIPEVDIILLSQPTGECLGAYTLLYTNFLSHFKSRIEVYSTLPIANLGRVSMIESYASKGIIGPYNTNRLDLEDIEKSFDHISILKYSQTVDLRSKFDGLSLIAYNSGSNPGGTIWSISTYSEKLIYVHRWNHTRDSILNPASLLDQTTGKPLASLLKPSGVITTLDKFGSIDPFKRRVKLFKGTVWNSLNNNGSVLIPVEMGSGKFLDILVIIHEFLFENGKNPFYKHLPVLLVSYSKGRALTYTKSMLEWLSSSLLKTWESRSSNPSPFDLGNRFKVVTSDELSKYPNSKICLVSNVDILLDETVAHLCDSKSQHQNKTTILLTSNMNNGILQNMKECWEEQKVKEGDLIKFNKTISVHNIQLDPLNDEELSEYKSVLEERKNKEKLIIESIKRGKHKDKILTLDLHGKDSILDASRKSSIIDLTNADEEEEDEEEDEDEDDALSSKALYAKRIHTPVDIIIQPNLPPKSKMFQFYPTKLKTDDYGTVIDFTMLIPKDDEDDKDFESELTKKRRIDRLQNKGQDTEDMNMPVAQFTKKEKLNQNNNNTITDSSFIQPNFDNIDFLKTDNTPQKRTLTKKNHIINCSISYINLESLVDQRSASVIWPSLKPRKLILFGPDKIQDRTLMKILVKKGVDVTALPLNKPTEFTTSIKAFDISIDPELDQILNWQRISDGYTIAHVTGHLVKEIPNATATQATKIQQNTKNKLILKPLNSMTKVHASGALSVGDVRLVELKRNLTAKNHVAEFKGEGTLVVDNKVTVRKISDGETVIDGPPSELFQLVKKSVTEMLAKI